MPRERNPCAKTVKPEEAYAVYQTLDGAFTYYVLRKYQTPTKEAQNIYARWYCMTVSPACPKGEFGDAYVSTVTDGTCLIENPLASGGQHGIAS